MTTQSTRSTNSLLSSSLSCLGDISVVTWLEVELRGFTVFMVILGSLVTFIVIPGGGLSLDEGVSVGDGVLLDDDMLW